MLRLFFSPDCPAFPGLFIPYFWRKPIPLGRTMRELGRTISEKDEICFCFAELYGYDRVKK